jgi:sugar lactone lactonase YvrE
MKRLSLVALAVLALAAGAVAAERPFPDVIPLPNGIQPEGISIGKGTTFYVGSIPTGAVYRGNLRTGTVSSTPLVPARSGRAAIGLEYDRGRLFVSGGPTGRAFVYDARTGADVANLQLTTATTFVNDVVVTRRAAWFTDSVNPVLYRVALDRRGRPGGVTTVPYSGDIRFQAGFNVNGIDATPDGKVLVVVQSNTGKLFKVGSRGRTREIGLGGQTVPNGDGILLDGRTLHVVRNRDNEIAKIRLDRRLRSGRIVARITDSDFDVPTTIDEFGRWLYAVNARFGTPPTPATRYQVVKVGK